MNTAKILAVSIVTVFLHLAFNANASSLSQAQDQAFNTVLTTYVKDGHVNYGGIKADKATMQQLEQYWNYIANVDTTGIDSAPHKLAYYLNTYNALSMKGILDGKSPSTYTGRVRFFYLKKYRIAQRKTNLYNFEHKVIRPLGEPRIHFALVCSSTSCPKLRSTVYDAENLEQQLTDNARDFINDTQKNRFDLQTKTAYLSQIFEWFAEDFVSETRSVQQYIAQFVDDAAVAEALKNNAFTIEYLDYDWSLNGTK